MGRPVNKRKFGALVDGTNITINCKVGSNGASVVGDCPAVKRSARSGRPLASGLRSHGL